jgi:alginate O-acetyltransferase complex protein AlgI
VIPLLSARFFVLLGVAVLLFHLLPHSTRKPYLLFLSYGYYATWGLGFAALLLAVSGVAFVAGLQIERAGRVKPGTGSGWFWGSVALLLGELAAFKYALPLAEQLGYHGTLVALAVPVGVSYYVFRLLSYVIDVRLGRVVVEDDFVAFALYAAFFPQILSGPIQRAGSFLRQVKALGAVDAEQIASGLRLMLFGLFEKLVVADHLSIVVNNVFDHADKSSGVAFALGAYCFIFQLYADFSGLTDIALGIGRLFGIEGPQNFNNPFYATNVQEFWRRWHMSLTSWLTDYLFTPLNIALRSAGKPGLVVAILVNMIAIGVWHGARWTFVTFGVLNGIFLVVSVLTLRERIQFFRKRESLSRLRSILGPLLTFHLMVLAFIFFRAASLHAAFHYLTHLVPAHWAPGSAGGLRRLGLMDQLGIIGIGSIPLMELAHWARPRGLLRRALDWSPVWLRWAVCYTAVVMVVVLGQTEAQQFIYAQF